VAKDETGNYSANYPSIAADGVVQGQSGAIDGDPDTSVGFNTDCSGSKNTRPGLCVNIDDGAAQALEMIDQATFSIELWFRVTCTWDAATMDVLSSRRFIEKADAAPDANSSQPGWSLFINASAQIAFRRAIASNDDTVLTGLPSDSAFHHLAAVYDGNNLILYLDGAPATSAPSGLSMVATSRPLHVGVASNNNFPFPGVLDEVAIYDKALDTCRIAAHYDAGMGRSPARCP
jgi:hypothetical protein